jgi:hypothetical protein
LPKKEKTWKILRKMEKEVKIEIDEIEIGDQASVLLKVAGLYASHLLSDINLVVGENQYPAHRGNENEKHSKFSSIYCVLIIMNFDFSCFQ